MFKRKVPEFSIRAAKKKKIETDLEKKFNESTENCVWEADELPVSVVRLLYQCITGKPALGELPRAINGYRNEVRIWLEKVSAEKNISDREVASKIRCMLRPADHVKLGIRQFIEAFDSGISNYINENGNSSTSTLINAPAVPQGI